MKSSKGKTIKAKFSYNVNSTIGYWHTILIKGLGKDQSLSAPYTRLGLAVHPNRKLRFPDSWLMQTWNLPTSFEL